MDTLSISIDVNVKTFPNLELAQKIYSYDCAFKSGVDDIVSQQDILADIGNDSMAPLYESLCSKYNWNLDEALLQAFVDKNTADLAAVDVQQQEAVQRGGEMEILDALFAKARIYSRIGNWAEAIVTFDSVLAQPKAGTGKKIDAMLEKARIYLFTMDITKLKELLVDTKKLVDIGGDWDRRNRLKVYEALSLVIMRDLRQASALFLECIATFTCVELCSYDEFIFYSIVASMITLPRTGLFKKLINNPQVIAVVRDSPDLQRFMSSLYNCDYGEFFRTMLVVFSRISGNRYFGPHTTYLVREYRVLAYSQFLEAYKSVRISSMADSFGISVPLLDQELSRFIASGRLNAKIDKVGGIVETSRPDVKNAQYQEAIKKGDVLLNHIQRLVRVIDV